MNRDHQADRLLAQVSMKQAFVYNVLLYHHKYQRRYHDPVSSLIPTLSEHYVPSHKQIIIQHMHAISVRQPLVHKLCHAYSICRENKKSLCSTLYNQT